MKEDTKKLIISIINVVILVLNGVLSMLNTEQGVELAKSLTMGLMG